MVLSLVLASPNCWAEGGGIRDEKSAEFGTWSAQDPASEDGVRSGGAESNPVYERQMRIGEEAMAKGNLEMAANFFQRAHATNPMESEPLVLLASLFKQAGRFGELAEIQQRLIRLEPDQLDYTVDYGLTLLRLGNIVDSRVQLHSALELHETPRVYNALGVTYDMEGDHRSAQAYYRIALQQDLEHLAALANLGLSLAITGDYDDAIRILRRLTAHPKSRGEHRRILAAVLGMSGDMEAAESIAGKDFDEDEVTRTIEKYGLAPAKARRDGI